MTDNTKYYDVFRNAMEDQGLLPFADTVSVALSFQAALEDVARWLSPSSPESADIYFDFTRDFLDGNDIIGAFPNGRSGKEKYYLGPSIIDSDPELNYMYWRGYAEGRQAPARDIEAAMPTSRDPWLSRAEASQIAREGL